MHNQYTYIFQATADNATLSPHKSKAIKRLDEWLRLEALDVGTGTPWLN